jgi:hypothetical protein
MSSMEPIVYTLASIFVLGQVIFLIPCAMALFYPQLPGLKTSHILHPESMFLIGFNILLFAPQGYMLPIHGDFVGMFVSLSALGSLVTFFSFFFVDIFRVSKDSIIDIEQSLNHKSVSQYWRIIQLPKSLKHGESLRLYVLLGICLGIAGTHLYAFVSLAGGATCIILSTGLVWMSLYAGRTNWFATKGRHQSKGLDNSRYGALN